MDAPISWCTPLKHVGRTSIQPHFSWSRRKGPGVSNLHEQEKVDLLAVAAVQSIFALLVEVLVFDRLGAKNVA
jgi:hypothetical protein